MKCTIVELEDCIHQFEGQFFRFNKETDCFEIYSTDNLCITIVAMFPKDHVVGVYYKEKNE